MAGGAREEYSDPCKYKILGDLLSGSDIIGLQEVVQVYEPDSCCGIRDDIAELKRDSGLSDYQHYFFPYLDSTQQSHPVKWTSRIFSSYYEQEYRILEGTAILVKQQHSVYDLWCDDRLGYAVGQVLPWYLDAPTIYLGNRDTQPRTLLLARVRLASKFVLFCCTHLATLKEEGAKQYGGGKGPATQKAVDLRAMQIKWIVQYIESYQRAREADGKTREPVIIVGDFNAEPKTPELDGLRQINLELVPFATPNVGYTHRKHKILIDLIYAAKCAIKGTACIVDLRELEALSDRRVSDHNPVIADLDFAE